MRNAGAAGEALIKPVHGADEESAGAVLRGHMHFYALIPVVVILASAAFGSVSIPRIYRRVLRTLATETVSETRLAASFFGNRIMSGTWICSS